MSGDVALAQRFDTVVVEIVKQRDYCLSDTHPRGRHKARVFRSRLGLTDLDAEFLRQALLDAARISSISSSRPTPTCLVSATSWTSN